jgi:hypothetical protein
MSEEDKCIETAKAAWRSQGVDERSLSIEYLRNRAFEQTKQSRSRSVIEYFLGCAAAVMCLWFAAVIDSVFFRVGVLVSLAGILYSLYEWWRRKMTWLTLEGSASDGLTFYKQELVRLRDLHRGLWKIYLPAGVPGAVMLLTWLFLERPETDNGPKIILAFAVAIWIIVTLRHEAREAKRYQRELDALSKNG